MPNTYRFQTQLQQGEQGEATLDAYFAQRYKITAATMAEQRRGIDRWFFNPTTGNRFSLDYKTDTRATQTGNVFVETKHSDRPGWAYTSEADWLFYYLPDAWMVYVVGLPFLRAKRLSGWAAQYPTRSAVNNSYTTYGLIVPLADFARCASMTFDLREELTS
ncbi:MAG: hypothetical protein IPK17_38675 [Chloroflexi bacterium]|uniref:hypothetical protein n=1 Tax=Candidatus Flexifilum breve TaxID=3140694 RepID=UPI003134C228|nr:hypothetical protein [Chloroflexota bacterium]